MVFQTNEGKLGVSIWILWPVKG